jgi:hypothetical protein
LYDAARTVSHATQSMMEAAERAQRAPHAAEPQVALRTAAENLRTVTTEVTSEQQAARTMHR